MISEGDPDEDPSRITRLFDEYRELRDSGATPDLEEFLHQARSDEVDELRKRIGVVEQLYGLGQEIAPDRSAAPRKVGRFEILSSLGSGGLSHVYLARDPHLDRVVALKVLDRGLVPDRRERAWILNEARSLAHLKHEGVVKVLEVGSADGYDFVALEHLSGPTLSEVLRQLRRGPARDEPAADGGEPAAKLAATLVGFHDRARLFHSLASALAYCHNRGVIHRDIKPANVVFSEDGTPKLIDFGLAHHGETDQDAKPMITELLVGSAAYVAPEQVEANQTGADPRSDQFSLATLFYEALALVNPFDAPSSLQTTQAVLRCELRDLRKRVKGLPPGLALIVHHALEREPDRRYPSVQHLADDLEAFLEHRPISVDPPSMPRRVALWTRRYWYQLLAASALVSTGVGTLFLSWLGGVREERAEVFRSLEAITNADLEDEDSFWEAGVELNALLAPAQSSDEGVGRSWFGEPLSPQVHRTIREWSDRLAAAIPPSIKAESPMWPSLVRLDERLCPECPSNLSERELGSIVYPEATIGDRPWELLRINRGNDENLRFIEEYEPAQPVRELAPGTYRLRVWEDLARSRCAYELGFMITHPRAQKRELVLHDRFSPPIQSSENPGNPFLRDAVLVPSTSVRVRVRGSEPTFQTQEFLICTRWVTIQEYEAYTKSPDYQRDSRETLRRKDDWRHGGEYAWTDLDAALGFAAWAGGRLPSIEELVAAFDQDLIQLFPEEGAKEWLRNQSIRDLDLDGSYFVHSKYEQGFASAGFGMTISRQFNHMEKGIGINLRIVFPAR